MDRAQTPADSLPGAIRDGSRLVTKGADCRPDEPNDIRLMSLQKDDERFMRRALIEAAKGFGRTSPNPAVGAVLVYRDQIVARGYHARPGGPHAEIACLHNFGRPVPPEATLYVTLEPCSTTGRTAPCTDELIKAGLQKIVIGALDGNPRHNGKGVSQLRKAGLQIRVGVLGEQCTSLNEAFNKWIVTVRKRFEPTTLV